MELSDFELFNFRVFEVRCLHIPVYDRTPFEGPNEKASTRAEYFYCIIYGVHLFMVLVIFIYVISISFEMDTVILYYSLSLWISISERLFGGFLC